MTTTKTPLKPSVVHTKETLMQFSPKNIASKEAKTAFIKSYYRIRNLRLADILEQNPLVDHNSINTTIRSLRFCSSVAITEVTKSGIVRILRNSKTCKNAHCAICSKMKSNKLTDRAIQAINDPANRQLFKHKHFYFLTLTVKHNLETRTGIYLKEFNQYCQKLFRSSLWKKHFPYSKKTPLSGWISSRECTFTGNGYHIHAHVIICAPRIKKPINQLQNEISRKWEKITSDSKNIRLDLIKGLLLKQQGFDDETQRQKFIATLKELFKYGTKTGKFEEWDDDKVNMYTNWIIATKRKNFINVSGLFRGLQITGLKSKYDNPPPLAEPQKGSKILIGKTTDLKFNYNHRKVYSTKWRKRIMEKITFKSIGQEIYDITEIYEEMAGYMACQLKESEASRFIHEWRKYTEHQKAKILKDEIKNKAKEKGKSKSNRKNEAQLKLFKKTTYLDN